MSDPVPLSPESWRSALEIVISKPHTVDKRLAGQKTVETYQGPLPSFESSNFLLDREFVNNLDISDSGDSLAKQFATSGQSDQSGEVIVQKLISRTERMPHYHQVVVKQGSAVQFIPLTSNSTGGSGMFQLELISDSSAKEEAPSQSERVEVVAGGGQRNRLRIL